MLLFHSHDENALLSWQSGVYYADGTPKASFWAVRDSLDRTRGGSIARCDGLAIDVGLTQVRFPGPREFTRGMRDTRFRCTSDCAWELGRPAPRPAPSRRPCAATGAGGRDDRRLARRDAGSAAPPCASL